MDLLGKILTTPGLTPPLIVLCVICFGTGGYFCLSAKFIWTHRNMVKAEEFKEHLMECRRSHNILEADMEILRKEFREEMRRMNESILDSVSDLKGDIKDQIKVSYNILDEKAEKIDKSYHEFKKFVQDYVLYQNQNIIGRRGGDS